MAKDSREYGLLDVKKDIDICTTYEELLDIQFYLDMVYIDFPEFIEPMCKRLIEYYINYKTNILIKELIT